jgi:hypothetical protein
MKSDAELVQRYIRDLREIRLSGGGVAETSYYGALERLLNAVGEDLSPQVRCILQLANTGSGNPDGGLFTHDQWKAGDFAKPLLGLAQPPARGAIEVKPFADDAWVTADSQQVSKYWERYGLILVTNYRDFVILGRDKEANPSVFESYRLGENEADFWKRAANPVRLAQEHTGSFVEFLRRVLLQAAPLTSSRDVAWFLASYARTARIRVGDRDLPALSNIRLVIQEALGLKFVDIKGEHFFRSTFIQTLFYGIFSAWVLWSKQHTSDSRAEFRWQDSAWLLQVPIVQKLFYMMSDPAALKSLDLIEILEWTASLLNRVDRRRFFEDFDEGRAVEYFYEPFLESFDPELRKDLGVWFTPPEIVKFMVSRVDQVLREELGVGDGLADRGVYVLDPCCGTGSYVVEVLRKIDRTLRAKHGDALVASEVKDAAVRRVHGFEILPAPFVVAHLQVGLLLQNLGTPLSGDDHERAGIYLTNALTGWEPLDPEKEKAFQALLAGFPELLEERDGSVEVKRSKPILVILGNPPYNAFAGIRTAEEQDLLRPYKAGLKDWGITKNYLNDLYVRFFRVAERRIAENTGRGVVSFISNYSWLEDPTYVVLRQHLLESFDLLWIENLHGDRKISERAADGKTSETIFAMKGFSPGIRQGVATSLWVKRGEKSGEKQVFFRDDLQHARASDRRRALLDSLSDPNRASHYEEVVPGPESKFSLRPGQATEQFSAWPALVDLAAIKPMLGLNENRAGALQGFDRVSLARRMQVYFDRTVGWDQIKSLGTGLSRPAAGFDPMSVRDAVLRKESFDESRLVPYLVRPLDSRWAYLSDVSPLWNRSRPELRKHLGAQFVISRPAGVARPEGAPTLFSRVLGEQDLMRGHAYFIPVRLPSISLLGGSSDNRGAPNICPQVGQYLKTLGFSEGEVQDTVGEAVWYHSLAVTHAPVYQKEHAVGLRRGWPRVPLPLERDLLLGSAELGRQVANLLDVSSAVPHVTQPPIRGDLAEIGVIRALHGGNLNQQDLALQRWGYIGKDGVVMPGKGKLLPRKGDTGKYGTSVPNQQEDALVDVYLNEKAYWQGIPLAVWHFVLGGIPVLRRWLSYRDADLLGRRLTVDEAREFTELVRRLTALIHLATDLDVMYNELKVAECWQWRESMYS